MSKSTYRVLSLVAASAILVGCSSSGSPPGPAATRAPSASMSASMPASMSASTPAPRPQACGAGAHAFWLPGPDGTKQEANWSGSGRTVAVFLHEAGFRTDMCGFWPFATWLAHREHVEVLLFNRCTYGNSTCQVYQVGDTGIRGEVAPAVRWARAHGARRVVLVGASSGASDALQAAGVVSGIDAVVGLSVDRTDTQTSEHRNAVRVRVPTLLAVAPGDEYSPVPAVRATFGLIPAHDKRLIIVKDEYGAHGWDLLGIPPHPFTPLAATVADFVARR